MTVDTNNTNQQMTVVGPGIVLIWRWRIYTKLPSKWLHAYGRRDHGMFADHSHAFEIMASQIARRSQLEQGLTITDISLMLLRVKRDESILLGPRSLRLLDTVSGQRDTRSER